MAEDKARCRTICMTSFWLKIYINKAGLDTKCDGRWSYDFLKMFYHHLGCGVQAGIPSVPWVECKLIHPTVENRLPLIAYLVKYLPCNA